ncbi:hypothetical protein PAAG_00343 [Paracoccidioides lutzii Pb01]|uniref:Uncharacterized protein n=1 Tax=Paracoccidioides lutzii (strain ATCC MYA-826 / Pb01) TaxID=502779 RepID=C1GP98_PARBA|nr:hypothetical protein PAAG_00343 [Paracoccidioides lutzii Pb01]EEH36020.1 hypothetical protein PAAG_00343 [Paracoccidioides lutzii Pb01]
MRCVSDGLDLSMELSDIQTLDRTVTPVNATRFEVIRSYLKSLDHAIMMVRQCVFRIAPSQETSSRGQYLSPFPGVSTAPLEIDPVKSWIYSLNTIPKLLHHQPHCDGQ